MKEPASDLSHLLWNARTKALAVGGEAAEEIAPGVLRAEAAAAAWHASAVQGGFSTAEIEAERLSKDRGGVHPTVQPDPLPNAVNFPSSEPAANHKYTDPDGNDWVHDGDVADCTAPGCAPVPVVNYEPGSKLEQLHAEYHRRKAVADSAAKELKGIVDALKVELTVAAPDQPKVELHGEAGRPLALSYVESWRMDTKKLKAEQPLIYVTYASKSGSWKLEAKRGGGS